jgi:preprotein translocase subunit SecD
MTIRSNQWNLILIFIIAVLAIWLDLPNHPGIHFLGIEKEIKTYLGLDLIGGTQALLEADVPKDQKVEAQQMETARKIIENRVNGLGVTEAVVQLAGERRIVVEIPGVKNPEQAISTIKGTALLEFIDMCDTPLPEETIVTTDYGLSEAEKKAISEENAKLIAKNPQVKVWHTVMMEQI